MIDKTIITSNEPNPCANWIRHHPIGTKVKINIQQDDENEVAPMILGREEFIDDDDTLTIVNEDENIEPLMLGREEESKRVRTK